LISRRISFGVAAAPPELDVDLSGFANVDAHFKRRRERPSVKKLLAYEKELNEGFAKTA
jgi:hypothetical protein